MKKAKQELLEELEGHKVLAATIEYKENTFNLKVGHSEAEFDKFLDSLNFIYDNGYGSQELYGTVWLSASEWLERGEYDGSEWWIYKCIPEITEDLK